MGKYLKNGKIYIFFKDYFIDALRKVRIFLCSLVKMHGYELKTFRPMEFLAVFPVSFSAFLVVIRARSQLWL